MIAILTATIIILSSLGPLLLRPAQAADPASWYKTVNGNLSTDTYTLYPFEAEDLHIGFSQFGELVDGNTKIGLEYGNTDPFATDQAAPPEWQWIEGWVINITYVQGGMYKNVWALATYSDYQDSSGIGGNWVENVTTGSLSLASRGGRRTSGGAVTDPITVLYDGPRRFVGMTKTTIYAEIGHTTPIVSITITFDFNKVKKYVSLIKDVKRIDIGKNIGAMQIEFGDRGEWDLAIGTPPMSYAHIWTDESTVYDENWQPWYADGGNPVRGYTGEYTVAQIIDDEQAYAGFAAFWPKPITTWVGATQEEADRPTILTSTSTITEDHIGDGSTRDFPLNEEPVEYPQNSSTGIHWTELPMVFLDGSHRILDSADPAKRFTYDYDTNTVSFPVGYAPADNAVVRIVYKVDKTKIDMSSEPYSPFLIGEWCFEMNAPPSQFRGVTVYGIVDLHDGNDAQYDGQLGNVLDREVQYQLDEYFNPWDLYQSIHKKTDRWIEYVGPGYTGWISDHSPVMDVSDDEWDQYAVFSERVVDLNTSTLLNRYLGDYTFSVDPDDGHATISGLTSTHWYEITYSTDTEYEQDTFNITHSAVNSSYLLGQTIDWDWVNAPSLDAEWTDKLNVYHDLYPDEFSFEIMNMSTSAFPADENLTWTYSTNELEWGVDPFKVFKEDSTSLEIGSSNWETVNVTDEDDGIYPLQFHINEIELNWDIEYDPEGPLFTDLRDVHFYDWDFDVWPTIEVMWNNATRNVTITATFEFISDYGREAPLYVEVVPGRYEWGVVGRDAASVDSAGLSLVSAAFKNKQVEYGLAGEDMYDAQLANQMPWVMNKIGTATETPHTFTNYYYYNYGVGYANDYRTALRSNWCTTWPVTTSNMIAVGGPLANMLSYYENDFSEAFYGLSQFTADPVWQNHIVARTCWMPHSTAHAYTSTNSTGYGIITSYLDLNGTVVLQLWGVWGRDTYYLTKWFHEYGIWQLQSAPDGLTSIIVKIPYTSYPEGYKPGTVSIVECLGTPSERLWEHDGQNKGGIHDP
jgi:hypothetical protein